LQVVKETRSVVWSQCGGKTGGGVKLFVVRGFVPKGWGFYKRKAGFPLKKYGAYGVFQKPSVVVVEKVSGG